MADGIKIKLNEKLLPMMKNRGMNRSVLAQRPFDFRPISFTSTIDGLKPKLFNAKRQIEWLEEFLDDPFQPKSYCLVSAPNDAMAKMLAAYMMQHAISRGGSRTALPLWHDLTGGFSNPLLEGNSQAIGASLLVLNNVGASSTQPKIEKLRDTLETYTSMPRIVVATGCDPFMFFTKYLYLPIHALAYMTTGLVRKSVEL